MCKLNRIALYSPNSYNPSLEYMANVLFYPMEEILDFYFEFGREPGDGEITILSNWYDDYSRDSVNKYVNNLLSDFEYVRNKRKDDIYIDSIRRFSIIFDTRSDAGECVYAFAKKLKDRMEKLFSVEISENKNAYADKQFQQITIEIGTKEDILFEEFVENNRDFVHGLVVGAICDWMEK